MPYLVFLIAFAVVTLMLKYYYLAAAEGVVVLGLVIYSVINRSKKRKALKAYIESVTYDTETAKDNTLINFPLPIVVFRIDDSRVVWGNEMFFDICGISDSKTDITVAELVPEFSGKWLMEGKSQSPSLLEVGGRKYQIYGNLVRPSEAENQSFMGIAYWLDVTDYDELRSEYEASQPVVAIFVIDNFEELMKNQPERIRNDLRDAVGDKLSQWGDGMGGVIRRFDRDRYVFIFEERYMDSIMAGKFGILEEIHDVVSPNGIHATFSIGVGRGAESMEEAMQFAELSAEMALSRGGDQAVIKNRYHFEFYGGKAGEIETRTKVKSRVMANALAELIKSSSQVLVMGHKISDMDSIGAAAAVCCIARKFDVKARIVVNTDRTAAKVLINKLRTAHEYKDCFISAQEAMLMANSKTLLVVVDTNRPEQVEDTGLLQSCSRLAVIDHHRRAATYIENAALSFIEPYASSACELMTEMIEVVMDEPDILKCEAEAILAGIVLDTKSFTLRTGERTFDAAAFLRRAGADTAEAKKFLQSGLTQSVAKYKILQHTRLYRGTAIAIPEGAQDRIVAAQAADELLNVAGVDASMVMYETEDGGIFVSARSIGEMNVQMIMEKLGGGGNRAAAAANMGQMSLADAEAKLLAAVDEYIDS